MRCGIGASTGTEGVEIVEAADGSSQFSAIVALLDGFTGATDLDANAVAIRTDIRYQTVAAVLRALAVANDAILHVTTARQVRLFQRGNLPASALGRLGAADLFRYNLKRDPRKIRSRQILRYGGAVAQRTITGDGSTRAFSVAGAGSPVDFMAAGVAARALNAQAGGPRSANAGGCGRRSALRRRDRLLRGECRGPGVRALCGCFPGPRRGCVTPDAHRREPATPRRGRDGGGGTLWNRAAA